MNRASATTVAEAEVIMRSDALQVAWLGRQPYAPVLALQERLLEEALCKPTAADTLLLLEHEHVYTLGRGADERDLLGAHTRLGVPNFRVGRGGGVTYHGPGQLVAYPIIRLRNWDVQRYVHMLEDALIATCACFGLVAQRKPDIVGVWIGDRKIASVGVGIRRAVSHHGIALNVAPDLSYFEHIIPCRESSLRFTSLAALLPGVPPIENVGQTFRDCFAEVFGYRRCEALKL